MTINSGHRLSRFSCGAVDSIFMEASNCATCLTVFVHGWSGTPTTTWSEQIADVLDGTTAWLIKKTNEGNNGRVLYLSREGAIDEGDPDLGPRLVLE